MLCQTTAGGDAGAAHMHNDFKRIPFAGGDLCRGFHPAFSQLPAFVFREHISFAGRSVDENTLKAVACQKGCITGNGFGVQAAVGMERRKGSVNKAMNLFHDMMYFI